MSQEQSCPFSSCHVFGSRKRLLDHIRSSHCEEELPADFVSRLNLLQCAHCKKWFQKLGQHSSQCKKRPGRDGPRQSPETESATCACDEDSLPASESTVSPVGEVEADVERVPLASDCRGADNPLDVESSALQFIRDISIDAILSAIPPRTVQTVKPAVRSLFQECCAVAFRKLELDPMDETAWKLLFYYPGCCFHL